jgi:uncharacterized DUF497 family protein
MEQRFKTLCLDPGTRVLLVVHAHEGSAGIRIISARKATKAEQRQYWQGLKHE